MLHTEPVQFLTLALLMVAGACFTLAAGHFFVWIQRQDRLAQLLFAVSACAAGGNAIAEAHFYGAADVRSFNTAFKVANNLNALATIALFWFLIVYSSSGRRWLRLRLGITGVFAFALIANLVFPYGFLFESIESLRRVRLPWGEVISLAAGPASHWRHLTDIAFVGMVVIGIDRTHALWQQGRHRGSVLIGGSFLFYLLLLLVSGFLTDTGLVELPYSFTWAYLLVGLAMSYELAVEVVRASTLSAEVHENERRWRALLQNVSLLVAGVDRSGCIDYANPFLTEVTGYSEGELLGTQMAALLPTDERDGFEEAFEAALKGEFRPRVERSLVTRGGETRRVVWSSVLLRNRDGDATGTLSIGADVTERRAAEQARDDALLDTQKALEELEELKHRLEDEVVYLAEEITATGYFEEIVGESDALKYALGKVEQVAALDVTVLIEGETGVGKELFARAIHRGSSRNRSPLVKVNCASLPESLIEDELFGHERGAFTGATRLRKGRFEIADGGTIFLDEIGELALELQGKLLRVLQEGEFERVGGEQTLKVNVRVIAATNCNLKQEVDDGRFREDLFYRLHVYPITVPSLRQRKEDLPLLARAFVERYAQKQGKRIDTIPSAVMSELQRYEWPGNVRELDNVIQRAVITTPENALRLAAGLTPTASTSPNDEPVELAEVERRHISRVLVQCDWRIEGDAGAARKLGLHANTLRARLRKLGIKRPTVPTS